MPKKPPEPFDYPYYYSNAMFRLKKGLPFSNFHWSAVTPPKIIRNILASKYPYYPTVKMEADLDAVTDYLIPRSQDRLKFLDDFWKRRAEKLPWRYPPKEPQV